LASISIPQKGLSLALDWWSGRALGAQPELLTRKRAPASVIHCVRCERGTGFPEAGFFLKRQPDAPLNFPSPQRMLSRPRLQHNGIHHRWKNSEDPEKKKSRYCIEFGRIPFRFLQPFYIDCLAGTPSLFMFAPPILAKASPATTFALPFYN
jgi:hypothetical protein